MAKKLRYFKRHRWLRQNRHLNYFFSYIRIMFELAILLFAKSYLDRIDKNDSVKDGDPNEVYRMQLSKVFFGVLFILSLIVTVFSFWLSNRLEYNIIYNLLALIPAVLSLFVIPVSLFFFLKCLFIQYSKLWSCISFSSLTTSS